MHKVLEFYCGQCGRTTRTPAPDLLAACKEALNYLHDTCDDNDLPPILTTMLNTAIAKAEGR